MDEEEKDKLRASLKQNEGLFPVLSIRMLMVGKTPQQRKIIGQHAKKIIQNFDDSDLSIPEDDTEEKVLMDFKEAKEHVLPNSFSKNLAQITSGVGLAMEKQSVRALERMVDKDIKNIMKEQPRPRKRKRVEKDTTSDHKPAHASGFFLGCCPSMLVRAENWEDAAKPDRLKGLASRVPKDSICLWCHKQLALDGSCVCKCQKCKRNRPECVAAKECKGFFDSPSAYERFVTNDVRSFREMLRQYVMDDFNFNEAVRLDMVTAQIKFYKKSGMSHSRSPLRTQLSKVRYAAACPLCNVNFDPKNGLHGFCSACRMHPAFAEVLREAQQREKLRNVPK